MSPTRIPAAVLLALWAGTISAQTVTLAIEDGRRIAQAAAVSGQPELARRVAAGLLEENRRDRAALIVLAAVEPQLGRPAQGRMAGSRAWRLSTTQTERYEAARLTALAAAREERPTLAQFWLRRAAANAPTDAALEQTGRDFGLMRRIDPLTLRFSVDVAPSSNVNGGSSDTLNVIDGLPFVGILSGDTRALSGWVGSVDAQLGYRIAANAESRTAVDFRLYGRGVRLSEEAREIAPDSENADFSAAYAAVTLSHDRRASSGSWGIAGTLGGNWYGGDLDYGFLRFGAHRQWQRDASGWRLSAAIEERRDSAGADAGQALRATAAGWRDLGAGRLSYAATVERVHSPEPNDRAKALRLSTGFAFAEAFGPAHLDVSGGVEARHYPDYAVIFSVPGGREDLRAWGTLAATFTGWSYAGFAPVVTLSGSRADSNVSRFDRSELSVGLSFRSTF